MNIINKYYCGLILLLITFISISDNPNSNQSTTQTVFDNGFETPYLILNSPKNLSTFNHSDDLSTNQNFQLGINFSTFIDSISWEISKSEGCDENYKNCSPIQILLTGTVTNLGAPEPTKQIDFSDSSTFNLIRIKVFNANGDSHFVEHKLIIDNIVPCINDFTKASVIRRPAQVNMEWTAPANDCGNSSSGVATSYDIRYSHSPITDANFAIACNLLDIEIDNIVPNPSVPGTLQSAILRGPHGVLLSNPCKVVQPFINNNNPTDVFWYIAIQATDLYGNKSLITNDSSIEVTYEELWLKQLTISIDNNAPDFSGINTDFLTLDGTSVGDIDGDGNKDYLTGFFTINSHCLFYGHAINANETIDTLTGTNHSCLLNPSDLLGGSAIVSKMAYPQRLGDLNADGYDDFGIHGVETNGGTDSGFFAIWLGKPTVGRINIAMDEPNIIIRGIVHTSLGPYSGSCSAGNFDGLNNTDDFVIGEPANNQVYIIAGDANWNATTTHVVYDLTTPADIQTLNPFVIKFLPNISNNLFGISCATADDILPTPSSGTPNKKDLAILQEGSADSRVFIFAGREWTTGMTVTVNETLVMGSESPEDLISVRLRQDSIGLKIGFGSGLMGGIDFNQDGISEFVVAHSNRGLGDGDGKTVFIFDGSTIASFTGEDLRIEGVTNLDESWISPRGTILINDDSAYSIAATNLDGLLSTNGEPKMDILLNSSDKVDFRFNHEWPSNGLEIFDFPVNDGTIINVNFPMNNSFSTGRWIEANADIVGADGVPDIITGSAKGEILITY